MKLDPKTANVLGAWCAVIVVVVGLFALVFTGHQDAAGVIVGACVMLLLIRMM